MKTFPDYADIQRLDYLVYGSGLMKDYVDFAKLYAKLVRKHGQANVDQAVEDYTDGKFW